MNGLDLLADLVMVAGVIALWKMNAARTTAHDRDSYNQGKEQQ